MNAYACAECGHEQSTMEKCEDCRSFRVVLIAVLEENFGENWRDLVVKKEER